ncbi:hypothetical protein PSECIP111951_01191 [Pseudoalteromonas holothuriae]|uniref:Uncharacterized protein n=1 Tax=Pseudoalteromonas holothuriae TaxID=2963714 RepID=A0A9W4QX79_9GAMM|nr:MULTISPECIES: hypothetical protein [unclassified Pseudoalteromonas]CAH9055195.1 hypothetical protein PSECIP111951_01191 [Pseudoalteromonas sp. CIP111951]CAH9057893.1 hypothetical protein PSECIP111854_02089 [Pseudoalteromonas sp. CIP111854]
MSASIKKVILLFVVLVQLCLLSACNLTPFQQLSPAQLVQQGNFVKAKQTITNNYSKSGNERLLYHLELASLFHLEKNFAQSNQHLSDALTLIDSFYTQSISQLVMTQFSGPTYATFKGEAYYVPQIHIMKALNFSALAKSQPTKADSYFDAALIEMRQLDVFLAQLKDETGGYNSVQTDDSLTAKINRVLTPVFTPTDLLNNIDYKDDAFAHFLSGVLFEQSAEFDSARLQYQRAMQIYENGFEQQYKLPAEISNKALAGLLRVMQHAGGYETELLALRKKHQDIVQNSNNLANVTVIQNIGIAPQRKQLNLLLKADTQAKALVMTPIVFGNTKERRAQMRWFSMLHADTSLFDMIQNYMLGDIGDVAMGVVTKRIPLGPLWDDAVKLGIIDALEFGSRISVTYLEPIDTPITKSEIWVAGKRHTQLLPYHSISLLTLQDALKKSHNEIQMALVRELSKALSAKKLLKEAGVKQDNLLGRLAKLSTSVVNAVTASADTRQWQTLPSEIRLAQFSLPIGEQQITIKTYLSSGRIIEHSEKLMVNKNMSLWHTHTFVTKNSEQATLTKSTLNME